MAKKSIVDKIKDKVGIGDEATEEAPVEETEEAPVETPKGLIKMVKKNKLDGTKEEEPYQTGSYHPDNVDDMLAHGWERYNK